MFHPFSSELSRRERFKALVASFAIGMLFAGLCHFACAVIFRNYKHIPSKVEPKITTVFQKAIPPNKSTVYDVPSSSDKPIYYKSSILERGETLLHFRTKGGGACAFHALFGEWNKEMYEHQEAQTVRETFVEYLRTLANRPRDIPAAFSVYCGEQGLSIDEPSSFQKYLDYLKNPETHLLQDELIALADWQQVSVRLIQRGWGTDKDKLQSSVLNDGQSYKRIVIYYDGYSHYERAEIVQGLFIKKFDII